MNQKRNMQAAAKRRRPSNWFFAGLLSVFFTGFVFVAGVQVGSGNWHVSFSNRAVQDNQALSESLDYASVNQVYSELVKKYDGKLDQTALLTGLKKGLVEAAGDPYTTYLDAEEAKAFSEQLSGAFSGIGAELGKEGTNIVVVAPISGFPAEKAGLRSRDVVVSIDGQDATNISVDEAVKRIRGEKGTQVKLVVVRGEKERLELAITRDVITIPSVESKMLDKNIGYIRVSRFSDDTVRLAQEAAEGFRQDGVKGVVLDLRGDPGGYLNAAVGLSSIWLDQNQLILQEKRDGKVVESFRSDKKGILFGTSTVVLINEGSASASEITAGALKDNNVAQIVGTKSYGKGSVQEFSRLGDGSVLKVTVARWFTPAGKNIDKEGIEPHIKVEMTEADFVAKKDPQLDRATQLLQ